MDTDVNNAASTRSRARLDRSAPSVRVDNGRSNGYDADADSQDDTKQTKQAAGTKRGRPAKTKKNRA